MKLELYLHTEGQLNFSSLRREILIRESTSSENITEIIEDMIDTLKRYQKEEEIKDKNEELLMDVKSMTEHND